MKQAVGMVITDKEKDLVLAVSRKDDHNDFGLPFGKREGRESPSEAAIRELKEETGLVHSKSRSPRVIYQGKEGGFECITFEGYLEENITQTLGSEETGIVKWMTWDELLSQGSFIEYNKRVKKAYDKRNN